MELKQLQSDMIAAMKAHDKERKDAISAVISAAKKIAIDEGKREEVPEEIVDRAIAKELKSVKEEIETCPADRTELKEQYQKRYDIIAEYAPKQLSADEIRQVINEKFADLIATKNRGQIMKPVMAELKGKADGKLINQIISDMIK